jgi:hypothetical protein
MEEAFKDADIVYPKSWAPYKVMEKRTELLRANDHEGLKALEKACLEQNAGHKDWHCTEEMMATPATAKRCICTACRRISPASPATRAKSPRESSRSTDPDLQRGQLEAVHHRRDDRLPQIREPGQGAGAARKRRNASNNPRLACGPAPRLSHFKKDKDRVCLLSH